MTTSKTYTKILSKLKRIRILVMDVDGVMTDGRIILGNNQEEMKMFDIQDGLGVTMAHMGGLKVGIITGRTSQIVERRAKELHVDVLYQGAFYKLEPYLEMLDSLHLTDKDVCYIGDDLLDLTLIERVGVGVATANARQEVKEKADFVTHAKGGRGAIREVVDLILRAQNKWDSVVEQCAVKSLINK